MMLPLVGRSQMALLATLLHLNYKFYLRMMLPLVGRSQMALLATLLLSAPASPAVAQETQA
jgi:hypothetical protein